MIDWDARLQAAKRHGFFSVMLLLDRLLRDRAPVGGEASPNEEAIRFRHDPSLTFSLSDISSIQRRTLPPDPTDFTDKPREQIEITTTFLGLVGAVSPLPEYFSEEVLQRMADDPRERDFLDIFHHRLISLFYRAWAKFDYPSTYKADLSDIWSRRLLSLLGFDPQEKPDGPRLPAWRVLRVAPLLAERHFTANALELALADGLALEDEQVAIEQFVGAWVPVALQQRTKLGQANSGLGQDFLLGSKIFDRTTQINVVLGPLGREGYLRFYGGGEPMQHIQTTIATLVADPLEYDVILSLEKNAAPPLQLANSGDFRLGRNAWLGGQPKESRVKLESPKPTRQAQPTAAPSTAEGVF